LPHPPESGGHAAPRAAQESMRRGSDGVASHGSGAKRQ